MTNKHTKGEYTVASRTVDGKYVNDLFVKTETETMPDNFMCRITYVVGDAVAHILKRLNACDGLSDEQLKFLVKHPQESVHYANAAKRIIDLESTIAALESEKAVMLDALKGIAPALEKLRAAQSFAPDAPSYLKVLSDMTPAITAAIGGKS